MYMMEAQILAERSTYAVRFSPQDYIHFSHKTPGTPENILRDFTMDLIHKVFSRLFPQDQKASQYQSEKVRVLDYGCGPSITCVISAAGIPSVSEIVLAEYTARNREAIQQWLDKDPSAFDWSPYFKHVVQTLEGKTEQQVAEREIAMHSLVKVVSCDITLDLPIEKGYEGLYDIVICCLCLETMCVNIDEYRSRVVKLSTFIKPGGSLLLLSTKRQPVGEYGSYVLGSERFYDLNVSYDLVAHTLEEVGLDIFSVDHVDVRRAHTLGDSNGFMFICAEKKK